MTTLRDSIISKVFTLTNRPDLVEETAVHLNTAVKQAHSLNYFSRDLREVVLKYSAPAYLQQVEYLSLFPLFGAVKYIRSYTPAGQGTEATFGQFFSEILPTDSLDNYNRNKQNVFYMAGDTLNIRSSKCETHTVFGYYTHPNLSEDVFDSWIAREWEEGIIMLTASIVFSCTLNNPTQGRAHEQVAARLLKALDSSSILATGY